MTAYATMVLSVVVAPLGIELSVHISPRPQNTSVGPGAPLRTSLKTSNSSFFLSVSSSATLARTQLLQSGKETGESISSGGEAATAAVPTEVRVASVMELVSRIVGPSRRLAYFDVFDYATLEPLALSSRVKSGGTILLLLTPEDATTLVMAGFDVESGVHVRMGGSAPLPELMVEDDLAESSTANFNRENVRCGDSPLAHQFGELSHMRRAVQALSATLAKHLCLSEQDMQKARQLISSTADKLKRVRENLQPTLQHLSDVVPFNLPDSTIADFINTERLSRSLEKGEQRLSAAKRALRDAEKLYPGAVQLAERERNAQEEFAKTEEWKFDDSLSGPADRRSAPVAGPSATAGRRKAMECIMGEINRMITTTKINVAEVTRVRKEAQKSQNYCNTVEELVFQRFSVIQQLPNALEAAHHLAKRRVVLRRAARRLLTALVHEHGKTEQQRREFVERWARVLPVSLGFSRLTAPLPSIYPPDDEPAVEFDENFRGADDETEEFLLSLGAVVPAEADALRRQLEECEERYRISTENERVLTERVQEQDATISLLTRQIADLKARLTDSGSS